MYFTIREDHHLFTVPDGPLTSSDANPGSTLRKQRKEQCETRLRQCDPRDPRASYSHVVVLVENLSVSSQLG